MHRDQHSVYVFLLFLSFIYFDGHYLSSTFDWSFSLIVNTVDTTYHFPSLKSMDHSDSYYVFG